MLVGEALVGLWVTSHSLEAHHYLIDTSFIVAATLLTLTINVILLRISFRPLFSLLATIRAISAGKTQARAKSRRPIRRSRNWPRHSTVCSINWKRRDANRLS